MGARVARVVRKKFVVPEVVRAAELGVGGKGVQGVGPLGAEGAKVHLPGDGVRERLTRSVGDGSRVAGAEEASPRRFGRIEVRAIGEEGWLGRRGSAVRGAWVEVRGRGVPARASGRRGPASVHWSRRV